MKTTQPQGSQVDPTSAELEKVRRVAATDGNAFHAKVARHFKQQHWRALISPYYVDNATGQAREVDLLCERVFPIRFHDENRWGVYRIQLFVECKYLQGPVVFWFDEQDRQRTLWWLDQHTPFKRSNKTSQNKHRYIGTGTHVAKLFRTDRGDHDHGQDPFYKGLAQSLGALIQRRGAPPLEDLPDKYGEPLKVMTVQYPVIVCSDTTTPGFYRTDIEDHPSGVLPMLHTFQLEVDYAYTGRRGIEEEYFLVDVVRFGKLDVFLESLQREADEATLVLGN